MLKKTKHGKEKVVKKKLIPTLLTIIIVLLVADTTVSVLTYVNALNTKPVVVEKYITPVSNSPGSGVGVGGVFGGMSGDTVETVSEEPETKPETPIRDVTVDETDFTGNEQQGDE